MARFPNIGWLPWRGEKPGRWTLALALALLAVVAAGLRTYGRTPFVGPVATWAALLALAFAVSTKLSLKAPWRGPNPVRNTLAVVLPVLWLAYLLIEESIRDRRETGAHLSWSLAMTSTVLFVTSIMRTRQGEGRGAWTARAFLACLTAYGWWTWWKAQ